VIKLIIFLVGCFLVLIPRSIDAQSPLKFVIEDFESEQIGSLPSNWFNQKGELQTTNFDQDLRMTYNYTIMEENNNKFLRFNGKRGKHMSFPLLNKKELDIYETPMLSWDWRILEIPEGGNEDKDDANDSAASIYVVFDLGRVMFKKVPKSIRYTWSSSLPKGKELSKFFGNQKIIVMGSGYDGVGNWQHFQRNIVEDYKRLFGDNPPNTPIGILILSDGNNTDRNAKADYDNFMLKSISNN
tara:strand:- start:2065 stop:2790 length:726 start_codon:yes stop_codon:yes gene_type:complete